MNKHVKDMKDKKVMRSTMALITRGRFILRNDLFKDTMTEDVRMHMLLSQHKLLSALTNRQKGPHLRNDSSTNKSRQSQSNA